MNTYPTSIHAQLQLGETDGMLLAVIYELPHRLGEDRRWYKVYASREDAAWDAERLALLPPADVAGLRSFPFGQEFPAINAYIRDPKQTLRGFSLFPKTRAQ